MKVLFDECVPILLRNYLKSKSEIKTVHEMGWRGIKNGELLKKSSENSFQFFITVDQNIPFQVSGKTLSITILVLKTKTSRLDELLKLVDKIDALLATKQEFKVIVVG